MAKKSYSGAVKSVKIVDGQDASEKPVDHRTKSFASHTTMGLCKSKTHGSKWRDVMRMLVAQPRRKATFFGSYIDHAQTWSWSDEMLQQVW